MKFCAQSSLAAAAAQPSQKSTQTPILSHAGVIIGTYACPAEDDLTLSTEELVKIISFKIQRKYKTWGQTAIVALISKNGP